ncbi:MAG: peptidoglycan-associated lipoprotein Pal [Pseudomonadota bacterium]
MSMSIRTTPLRAVLIAAALAAGLAGCAQSSKGPDAANLSAGRGGADGRGPATPGSRRDFAQNVGDLVYFTTDSTDLTPEAEQTLRGQARWLNQYARFTITVEGHADERGTREYNIALGARRAESVKRFLASNGVDARRIRTISFGKERPVAVCNDISCWSQNRRAQTVLNNRAGSS